VTRPWRRPVAAWQRFWFTPQPTAALALFRIAFGLLVTAWTLSLAPDLPAFFGPDAIAPDVPGAPGSWGLLTGASVPAVVAVFVATVVAGVALTLGLFTRLAAVVVLVGVVSFEQRNALIGNSGDALIRNLAFYCALAPSGVALSLDRLRRAPGEFWRFPARAPWALRLVQIQLSIGYFSAVWHKVSAQLWRDGTAVSYALRMQDYQRFVVPGWVTHSVLLTEALTFGTLALELALAVLVWNRTARPWVLALGAGLHLGIDYALVVGFFGLAMLVTYLAFVPPETAVRWVLAVRDRVRSSAAPPVARSPGPPSPAAPTAGGRTSGPSP
jgi:Vitamin K-dependent gamma-carboxylase